MAKIDYHHPASQGFPEFTDTIEVRVWGACGTSEMPFYIGSGANSSSLDTLWVEIIYSVEGAQIFYTRNFLHEPFIDGGAAEQERLLQEVLDAGEGNFGFTGMLPETSIRLTMDGRGTDCSIKISADTGAVFKHSGPGWSQIVIYPGPVDAEVGARFFRDLIREIGAAYQGHHPDPAAFPTGSSEWYLPHQLNRAAYDKISEDYKEQHFRNPLLARAFESWLAKLPPGGAVLDVGCGHGDPVIGRLLEEGFAVTGSDFSSAMLRRARERYPEASFIQAAATEIDLKSAFDGVCSFQSILYLDPIDMLNAFHRLHGALKPDGLLFLYGYDSAPSWRGEPFTHSLNQWMWTWHYGMEEAAGLLEEHGRFEVLSTERVVFNQAEEERISRLEEQNREQAELGQLQPDGSRIFYNQTIERPSYAYVIIARRCER